ncbi:MAG TPA: PAS domain S-box protein, partial [Gemmataceae bacterium]|nr:PAS domain S-box protein [Gemmataceae bacterium]
MPFRMQSPDEVHDLRRCVRDLVAFSTLPAVWEHADPSGVGRGLAEVLLRILSADFVYVRLNGRDGGPHLESLRTRQRAESEGRAHEVGQALEPWLCLEDADAPPTIPSPVGQEAVRLSVLPLGHGHDYGLLAAGCGRPDFPTDTERLLLGVAANQAAGLLQRKEVEEELRKQSEWQRVTLASIGDAVITTDTEGRVTSLNSVAESLTGWTSRDAQGVPLDRVFHIVNEQTRQAVESPATRALREGRIVGLANHTVLVAKDGTERPIDDSAAPIKDDRGGVVGVVLVFRDVSGRKRVEQQRNVRLAVTHALSEAGSVEDAAGAVLRAVCENLGWDVGFFWTGNEGGSALACRQSWHRPGVPVEDFEKGSCSRTFGRGQGLPGRVWASGKPAWILDIAADGNFPRLAPAVNYGLHSAFACPVVVGEQTLGVIEFFTRRIHEPDEDLLEMMGTVAGSVGQFIERKAAEDELRRSEQELADFFENATVGLHWVGPDGTILRANQAELDMLGYSREEYVGRPVADFHADEDVICDILKRLRAGQKLDDYPARLRCKDGSIRDVLIDSSVMWRDGQFVHTRCFTRDITERKRAEARVREQEQRTRTILESITDAFCAFDRDWRFTYVNRQAEVLLGRSRDDLIGKNHWQEYPDTVGTDVEHHYRRAVAENVTATFEFSYPPHDRWYECHAYPSPDGLSVYFRDVSERKRAEIVLRESEQRFRQLADAMPQIVWAAGPDGNIDYLNRRWTEFTGLPQTAGNDGWGHLLHPDEAKPAGERWAASVANGAPFEMELRLLDRRRQSYRWHLIRTVAVPDGEGTVARWFGTGTDIHEQKRAEESSRFLAEASAELAAVVDYESTLQKVASLAVPYFADWSAVDLADEEGSLWRLAVAHQDADKIALVRELMREFPPDPQSAGGAYAVLRTGKPELVGEITDEMLVREAKGERHLCLIRSLGLKSYVCVPLVVSGRTLGLLTFATAESGRRDTEADLALAVDLAHRAAVAIENTQLYQALREADRRKDEFLATLAHELRNPLAPVRNALQILKMPRVDAQTVERSRDMMERQVQHLVRLVDDLLDVSRVMRGKIELRRERVELASVVARAVETVQPLVDAQRHELSVRIPSDSLLLDADPVRMAQVVGNLLTNAAKYTEPNGRICLTAEREGDMAVLRVRDNGIGIAPAMLPRIFELFVQVDHASTKAQGGLGIGLTLVKNLVEMHGGTVEARSEGLGQGCEFVVRLPITAQPHDQDRGSEAGDQVRQPSSSGHRL